MLIWLLLILLVLVLLLMLLGRFSREEGTGSRRDFFVRCPNALAASSLLVMSLIGGLLLTFQFLLAFVLMPGWLTFACPIACQPLWPACWLDTLDRSSSSSTRDVQDVWDVFRDEFEVVPDDVVLALRDAASRFYVDDFWTIWE